MNPPSGYVEINKVIPGQASSFVPSVIRSPVPSEDVEGDSFGILLAHALSVT